MSRFPDAFVNSLNHCLPSSEVTPLLESLTESHTTSIRLNPYFKGTLSVSHETIAHADRGFFLMERPLFTADPAFHAGAYYPQEANSMWIGAVFSFLRSRYFNPDDALKILDLCASPGGKTTDISSRMRPDDVLVSNEVISSRNSILFENVCKWGLANTVITKADASLFGKKGPLFDMVFVDAPCSGEGMFRKDHDAIAEWSPGNVTLCTQRQQRIVMDVWNALTPGGFLIYSTCTFNRSENEDNIAYFENELGALKIPFEHANGSVLWELEEFQYRCMPHRSKGEGLFFCILQKPGEWKGFEAASPKNRVKSNAKPVQTFEGFSRIEKSNEVYLLNASIDPFFVSQLPGLVHPGVPSGGSFNGKWKPHSAIALVKKHAFSLDEFELDDFSTMQYLRREFIHSKSQHLGIVVVTWKNHRLGTANAVKNGLNNLWPMEWRIRNELTLQSIVE